MLQPIISPVQSRTFASAKAAKELGMTRRLHKRETLFRSGDLAYQIYEVLKGWLFIYKLLDDGRRQIVDLVRPGDMCGFTDGSEYDSSCETLSAVTLIAHERSSVLASPGLQQSLLRQLDKCTSAAHQHALTLGRKTATERVASLIMQLVSARGPSYCPASGLKKPVRVIQIPMTRGEIADYLGLTLETVCRTMTDMERREFITISHKRGEISIAGVCRLCRLAKTDVCSHA